jgi:hypothetical protein
MGAWFQAGALSIGARYILILASKTSRFAGVVLYPFGNRLSLSASPPLWNQDRHAERRARLLARQRIARFVRRWFEAKGFVEVDPAALQPSPGNETHLIGFETTLERPDGSSSAAYLHTSPEFAMKKLLTSGETRIFALSHVFRNRERPARAGICDARMVPRCRAADASHG